MSRIIAVMASGFMLAACSVTMPSLSLDFMRSAPQDETLAIDSEPRAAEAKTSLGQSCRTSYQLRVQPGSEFSVTLTLNGYQPQTVSVRPKADDASATRRLAPNPVHVDLQAVARRRSRFRRKRSPLQQRPARQHRRRGPRKRRRLRLLLPRRPQPRKRHPP